MRHPKDIDATIIETGKKIVVYKLNNGNYADALNCSDIYEPKQIRLSK